MRKILFSLISLLLPIMAVAQTVQTPNIGLQLPAAGSTNWNLPLNYNFQLLDSLFAGIITTGVGLPLKPIYGTGSPSASCTTSNEGQQYFNLSTTPFQGYICHSFVWSTFGGSGSGGGANPGTGYALGFYNIASPTNTSTLSPSNIHSDSGGNNLFAPGYGSFGSAPPTVCGTIPNCWAFGYGSSAPTPTTGVHIEYGDSVTNTKLCSDNGGSFGPCTSTSGTAVKLNSGSNQTNLSISSYMPTVCADTSGSGTAQSCTTTPSFTPQSGNCVLYTTTTTNSGTGLTININSLGAKSVAQAGSSGWTTTLTASTIPANKPMTVCYDGTNWNASGTGYVAATASGVSSLTATSPCTANGSSGSPQTGAVTVACTGGGGGSAAPNGVYSVTAPYHITPYLIGPYQVAATNMMYQNQLSNAIYVTSEVGSASSGTGSMYVGSSSTNLALIGQNGYDVTSSSTGILRGFVPASGWWALGASTAVNNDSSRTSTAMSVPNMSDSGDLVGSRALATVYQNTTGKLMFVQVSLNSFTANGGQQVAGITDSSSTPTTLYTYEDSNNQSVSQIILAVLPSNYYKITAAASGAITHWHEWTMSSVTATQSSNLAGAGRALGTVYQNTSGFDMFVSVSYKTSATGTSLAYIGTTNAAPELVTFHSDALGGGYYVGDWFFVPAGWYYEVNRDTGASTFNSWYEITLQ